jgi:integrase/recombinase XerD
LRTWQIRQCPLVRDRPVGVVIHHENVAKEVFRDVFQLLSTEEVTRMLAGTRNLKHWSILATIYATGLRCSELQHLKVGDIDSKRTVLHVREGKGGVPLDIALPPALLERLRIYFRQYRPKDWLFPSWQNHGSMMDDRSFRYVCRQAAKRASIKRRVHPHLFRHACATHMLDGHCRSPRPIAAFPARASWAQGSPAEPFQC